MNRRNHLLDLNGTWKFILDKDDSGGEKGYMLTSCDTACWRSAEIPCTYEGAAQECTGYRGTVWFRKSFTLEEIPDALLWLEFAAVNYRADIWINEKSVGFHIGDYLPFRFEISEHVRPGENLLCVRVNNRVIPGMLPPSHFWRGHGGIIRSVSLYSTPACYIRNVKAVKGDDGLHMVTEIVNRTDTVQTVSLKHICPENGLTGETTAFLQPMSEAVTEVLFPLDTFALWELDNPVLYTCQTVMTTGGTEDNYRISFGVRDICTEDGKIYLNGKEIHLRGFNRHEDSPRTMLATDVENAERDFGIMKKMKANFVRLCHYSHSEEELDICDRLGLLVLSEIPFNAAMVGIKEYNETETKRALPQMYIRARTALKNMIERDYNHPCVMFWSVSNESNESIPQIRQMNEALIRYAKELDDSRFAVHVSQGCWWYNPELVGSLFTCDDVICINAYVTMERGFHANADIEEFNKHASSFWDEKLAVFREKYPGKPIVVTEFGYPSDKMGDGILDQETQSESLLCDMQAMEGRISGYAIWHFTDHEWEIAEDGTVFFGSNISPYGVFTRERKPKECVQSITDYWDKL
ncbi:MAG: hypothetical protein E7631_10055 [Ruminococcaceae bacterium]|nr:hypothetical protein [Oscillospiraceae bacterium]